MVLFENDCDRLLRDLRNEIDFKITLFQNGECQVTLSQLLTEKQIIMQFS